MAEYKQPTKVPTPDTGYKTDPNTLSAKESTPGGMPARRVSAGDPGNTAMNKNGETQIRGCGAATKGTKARGPMA